MSCYSLMKVRKSTKALRSLQKTPQSKRVINLSAWPGPSSTYRLWGYPLREKLRAPDNWSFEPDRRRRGIFYCSRQAVQHSWTGRHTVCRFQASTLSSGVSGCTLNAALPLRGISHHCHFSTAEPRPLSTSPDQRISIHCHRGLLSPHRLLTIRQRSPRRRPRPSATTSAIFS